MAIPVEDQGESFTHVGRQVGWSAPQHITILEERGKETRQPRIAGVDDHTGEAGMEGKIRHGQTALRRETGSVQGAETFEKLDGGGPCRFCWRVEERQFGRIADAPSRQVKHERRDFHFGDLRGEKGWATGMFKLGPESVSRAWPQPPGAPRPLVR